MQSEPLSEVLSRLIGKILQVNIEVANTLTKEFFNLEQSQLMKAIEAVYEEG